MRETWMVLGLLTIALGGCIDADTIIDNPPSAEAATASWWMSCDWAEHAPAPAQGDWMDRRVLNIAHQGGENEAPSNTMYALKTSFARGADVLEIDVHVTADQELVVIHDTTVDRTTDGSGNVEDFTLAELKALDAAHWFVSGRNTPHDADLTDYVLRGARNGDMDLPPGCTQGDFTIPTLREVLDEFPDVMINIEIKNGAPQGSSYGQLLAQTLQEYGRSDDTMIASFIDTWGEEFRTFAPEVSTSTGTGQSAAFFASTQADAPGLPNSFHEALQVPIEYEGIRIIDEAGDFVADAHANGFAVHVWTVDDPETVHWLLDIGVDGIMTAEPSVVEQVLQERGVAWN